MENEIKDNEYIRTDTGKIDKVINANYYMPQYIECEKDLIFKNNIVKHSSNLIDLIQCGDYVNGILVTGKESTLLWTEIKGIDRSGYHIPISQYGENIKTIVTKEMMESISYKVTKM